MDSDVFEVIQQILNGRAVQLPTQEVWLRTLALDEIDVEIVKETTMIPSIGSGLVIRAAGAAIAGLCGATLFGFLGPSTANNALSAQLNLTAWQGGLIGGFFFIIGTRIIINRLSGSS